MKLNPSLDELKDQQFNGNRFFFKILGGTSLFCVATDTPVLDFW